MERVFFKVKQNGYLILNNKNKLSNHALQLSGGRSPKAGQTKPKASKISKAAKQPPTEL